MTTDGPNFGRLPAGTKEQFERRLERLPLDRVRTRVDFDAARDNEVRFKDRFCAEHHVDDNDPRALGTWHLGTVGAGN